MLEILSVVMVVSALVVVGALILRLAERGFATSGFSAACFWRASPRLSYYSPPSYWVPSSVFASPC